MHNNITERRFLPDFTLEEEGEEEEDEEEDDHDESESDCLDFLLGQEMMGIIEGSPEADEDDFLGMLI